MISILLKLIFWQTSIHSQSLVKNFYIDRTRIKSLLKRLKNIGTASEKLYRNTLKHALRQEISNRQKWQRNKRPLDILVAYSNSDDNAFKLLFIHLIWFVKVASVYYKTSFLISLTTTVHLPYKLPRQWMSNTLRTIGLDVLKIHMFMAIPLLILRRQL